MKLTTILLALVFVSAIHGEPDRPDAISSRIRNLLVKEDPARFDDPEPREIIAALGLLGGDSNAQFLAAMLPKYHDDSFMRSRVIRAIGWTGSKTVTQVLLRVAAEDPESLVRSQAVDALRAIKDSSSVGPMEKLLRADMDKDRWLRITSALREISGNPYPTFPPPSGCSSVRAYLLAHSALANTELTTQRRIYNDALSLDPKCPYLNLSLGEVYAKLNDPRARQYHVRAFELEPGCGYISHGLAQYLVQAGDLAEARRIIESVLPKCSTDWKGMHDLQLDIIQRRENRTKRTTAHNSM